MVRAIGDLQEGGVEPDVWKIEGLEDPADCARVVAQARVGGRDGVGCVVLGRGADVAQVERWLRAGAATPGCLGFAIGRSIWWDPVEAWLAGAPAPDAAEQIAARYARFMDAYATVGAPTPRERSGSEGAP